MPETGASGSVGAPLEQSEGATRQQGPPYGLPPIYSVLPLSSPPLRWRGHWVLFLTIVRSFLALRIQKQKASVTWATLINNAFTNYRYHPQFRTMLDRVSNRLTKEAARATQGQLSLFDRHTGNRHQDREFNVVVCPL